jgi:hypothetical protein
MKEKELEKRLEKIESALDSLYKFYPGVYLCRECDRFTSDPEHKHGEKKE